MKRSPLNRVRKTPLAALKREADKIAGEKCRARGKCQACGSTQYLQWAHILSRRYHHIRWIPQNCMALCRSCHYKYTINPDLWIEFLLTNYSPELSWLITERNRIVKVNRVFMEETLVMLKTL